MTDEHGPHCIDPDEHCACKECHGKPGKIRQLDAAK